MIQRFQASVSLKIKKKHVFWFFFKFSSITFIASAFSRLQSKKRKGSAATPRSVQMPEVDPDGQMPSTSKSQPAAFATEEEPCACVDRSASDASDDDELLSTAGDDDSPQPPAVKLGVSRSIFKEILWTAQWTKNLTVFSQILPFPFFPLLHHFTPSTASPLLSTDAIHII